MRVKWVHGLLLLVAVAALAAFAGCGDDDDEESADSAATTEETSADNGGEPSSIAMTEYAYDPGDFTVPAGNTLTLSNDGEIPHNLTIVEGTDPLGGGAELAASDDIAPGKSGALGIDVEPGEYGFLCTIPGHAEDGMVGTVTVTE